MKRVVLPAGLAALALAALVPATLHSSADASADWADEQRPPSRRAAVRCSASATSTPQPAGARRRPRARRAAAAKHFCRANIAYKINKGHYGSTNLDGAKFWIASDLGGDFSKGEMDWAVLYFDKSLTPEQREGIGAIAGNALPGEVELVHHRRGRPSTSGSSTKDEAHALLDGGKTARGEAQAVHRA